MSYNLVFKADRNIISKGNLFIGRAYLQCNLFKLSIVCKNFVYNVDVSSNIFDDLRYLWHLRLEYMNFDKVSFIRKNDMIPYCPLLSHNCKTSILNKIT